MSVIPPAAFNLEQIAQAQIAGRGGKERQIRAIFSGAVRTMWTNHPLFDVEVRSGDTTYHVEFKKQKNLQWFDVGKYHDVSLDDTGIVMLFLLHSLHSKGMIDTVAAIHLGDFVQLMMADPEMRECGWTEEVMEIAADLKRKYPKLQFKVSAPIRDLLRRYGRSFQVVYPSDHREKRES